MSATTSIEWTDRTWNPTTGCHKVSPGCKNCYAEAVANRFWAKQYPGRAGFTDVRTHVDRLSEPLSWKKPARIFVNSMSDLFDESIPNDFIAAVFGVMACAPQHTFQVLTKRPARMRELLGWLNTELVRDAALRVRNVMIRGNWRLPLPNVHLGVSVENQETADDRIQWLLQTPAAVRFLSVEPLLEEVNLRVHLKRWEQPLHWVIVGGESGPGARPCNAAWIRSIVAQCKEAGVPCFVKQRGALWYDSDRREGLRGSCAVPATASWRWVKQSDRKGGDLAEWPADLCVREFPA